MTLEERAIILRVTLQYQANRYSAKEPEPKIVERCLRDFWLETTTSELRADLDYEVGWPPQKIGARAHWPLVRVRALSAIEKLARLANSPDSKASPT